MTFAMMNSAQTRLVMTITVRMIVIASSTGLVSSSLNDPNAYFHICHSLFMLELYFKTETIIVILYYYNC